MNKYLHDLEYNKIFIYPHKETYSIFNLMKGIHGNAHYFFNGFSEIMGTNEIAINLIKADENGIEYHPIMYHNVNKKINKYIMFTDKYEFVNFNDIKDFKTKWEIGKAIRLYSEESYKQMFEQIGSVMYDQTNFQPSYKLKGLDCDDFNYKQQAEEVDTYLDKVVDKLNEFKVTGNIAIGSNTAASGDYSIGIRNDYACSGSTLQFHDGTSKLEWIEPQNYGMKIIPKKSKKRNNKVCVTEDKLIIL